MVNTRNIVKKIIPNSLFRKIEPTGHLIESILANVKNGFPAKKMHVIGVTGTNGKTTTSFMIYKILQQAGYKVGILSTVAYGVGDDIKPQIEHITTAQAGILQKRLRDFKDKGVEWLVLESSSHALAQNRTWGINYEVAVMTNVTYEHLDYHETFDNYLQAKRRLFSIVSKNKNGFGVINANDENFKKFIDEKSKSITYGIGAGELQAKNIQLESDGSKFDAIVGDEIYHMRVNIPGEFNVCNSLAAIATCRHLGLTNQQIVDGVNALDSVEGRMSVIKQGQPFRVIVDFASTPDAFEKIFESVRPATKGKLIAVFGSAGRRDEAKRSIQGKIAGRFCDEIILTEEDDRDVDGNQILEQIASGAEKAGKVKDKDMFLILDRKKAIKFALNRAKNSNDTVILLGKGHEKTIERADGIHNWNEIEVVRELLG